MKSERKKSKLLGMVMKTHQALFVIILVAMLPIPVFSDMPMATPTEEPPLIQFTDAHLTKGIISEIEYDNLGNLAGAKIYLGFENMGGSGTVTFLFKTTGQERSKTYEIENAGRYDLFIHVGLSYLAFHDDELEVSSPNQIGNSIVCIFEEAQIIYIKKILLIPILPPPEVYYVDHRANGSGNGLNWENALQYVQTALQLARFYEGSVHEIRVAQGTYQPDTLWSFGLVRKATFQLIDDIEVKGGYAGVGQTDPDARDIELYATVLSGDRWGDDVDVSDPCDLPDDPTRDDNSYHVVTGSGTDANAVLDGFTITGGNAIAFYPNNYGGGLFVDGNSSPTLIDCTFTGNSAKFGGGMGNYNSRPTLTNCTFSLNSAVNYGGGFINDAKASPTLIDCNFTDNSAAYGGGMRNQGGSSPTLTGCTFSGNSAANSGGGMRNKDSSPSLTDCTFTSNSATHGGAIADSNSSPSLTNCTFTANSATYGGAIIDSNSSPTMTNCMFTSNTADEWGGGMFNEANSSPMVIGCLFTANSATYGGAIADFNSSSTVTNCTFSGNSAANSGGAMLNYASGACVTNCTFTGNSADNYYGGGMYNEGNGRPTVAGCIFSSNSANYGGGVLNFSSSPMLTNCTFIANSAESYGGGIYEFDNNPTVIGCAFSGNVAGIGGGGTAIEDSTAMLVNCSFSGNAANNGNALACESEPQQNPSNVEIANCILWDGGNEIWNNDDSMITITYSDVQDSWLGEGNINADPCFVQLGCWVDANDPNIIVEPNDPNAVWVEGNYRLRPDSPCIDAGDNNSVPPDVTTDLDGHPRFIDDICTNDTGNPPGADAIVDMGAYEFLRSDIDSNGAVDLVDFSRFALYWKESGCGACGGADLTCDGDVDLYDLKEFGDNWLAGL